MNYISYHPNKNKKQKNKKKKKKKKKKRASREFLHFSILLQYPHLFYHNLINSEFIPSTLALALAHSIKSTYTYCTILITTPLFVYFVCTLIQLADAAEFRNNMISIVDQIQRFLTVQIQIFTIDQQPDL